MRQRVSISKFSLDGPEGPFCFVSRLHRGGPAEAAAPSATAAESPPPPPSDSGEDEHVLEDFPVTEDEAAVLSRGDFPPRIAALLGPSSASLSSSGRG
jgi:hypothetical protein